MPLYCGIDLHSNNHFVCVTDDKDKRLLEVKLDNDPELTIRALSKYKKRLKAIAVESTFNWYWLVDALMAAGFKVELVNTAKVVQYSGLKRTNDRYDAFHLAHLMRLDILPTGYIYPKADRSLRDLLRKRIQLVQDRSSHIVRFKLQIQMHTGQTIRADHIKAKKFKLPVIGDDNVQLALQSHLSMVRALHAQISVLEKSILKQISPVAEFNLLKTTPGIGDILAEAIWLETGDIDRFKGPGNFASYCRCVDSRRESNGKKKGENNRKNGNKYLAWAFIEAANFAIQHNDKARSFYQKKSKATNVIVARKALAHKLARACYWVMKKKQPFNEDLIFH
ncbi:MAG: IS110 family transposase [Desulfobulbaceae bacterium]|nr:IS110 family transposase [Desulfobulbaceae bacterium]